MPSCNKPRGNQMMRPHLKVVGKSGQISIGKNFAGTAFLLEPLEGGDFLLKKASVFPSNESWIHAPAMQAKIKAADEWMESNPASTTDLDELESRILNNNPATDAR